MVFSFRSLLIILLLIPAYFLHAQDMGVNNTGALPDASAMLDTQGIQYGFTAQNIQAVFPELVSKDADGFLQTAYGTYDAMYMEAFRALTDEIEILKLEYAELKVQAIALYLENKAQREKMFLQQTDISSLVARLANLEKLITDFTNHTVSR